MHSFKHSRVTADIDPMQLMKNAQAFSMLSDGIPVGK